MSAPRYLQLLDIKNVVAGGVAVVTCPRGVNYKRVIFGLRNSAAANVNAPAINAIVAGDIQMKANGAIQRTINPLHLAAINALQGAEYAPNAFAGAANGEGVTELAMHFEEPWRTRVRRDSVDPSTMGFRTAWLPETKPLQFYIPLAAGITPVLYAVAEVDDDDNGQPSKLMKYFTDSENVNGTQANLLNIAKGVKAGDRFSQISVFNTSDARTPRTVRLEIADTVVFEDIGINTIQTINEGNDMDVAGANAQANGAHLVFDANDALDDTIPANFSKSTLKVGLSAASAGIMPYVVQRWGMPEGV